MLRVSRSHTIPRNEHSVREDCHLKQEGAVKNDGQITDVI